MQQHSVYRSLLKKIKTIPRDVSWLSFNARVLQEAADRNVPLDERLKFLGIVSNNLDEFFRVRVASLNRLIKFGIKAALPPAHNPADTLRQVNEIVLQQQIAFYKTWSGILADLKKQHIYFVNEKQLSPRQKNFVLTYFNDEVRGNIVPLMMEEVTAFPVLNDKSIYLACTLAKRGVTGKKFAMVSVPARRLPRFVILPDEKNRKYIILLEDVIRCCLPQLFSYFDYNVFTAHIVKITRDSELDLDNDVSIPYIQKLEKGLKKRKKGNPVRFVYDKEIDSSLLEFLFKKTGITGKDSVIPGGRIHNFNDFINFPKQVFATSLKKQKPFTHPALAGRKRITDVVMEQDILLHTPWHSFNSIIDFLREAAIDPSVKSIKITCYRLAARSKIINALSNAVRNGKEVTVVIELQARFDEEANLEWKEELEDAGVTVLLGVPGLKVHAKICSIKKTIKGRTVYYGFTGTGNLNERTAEIYTDMFLLTSDRFIMADINRMFTYLENPRTKLKALKQCKTLLVSPVSLRNGLTKLINKEISNAKKGKPASIILKLNSLSDYDLIAKLHAAALAGVKVKLIIRGICCMLTQHKKFPVPVKAVSIVDSYLEHSRVFVFYNSGNEKVFISSADWMTRNMSYRVEAACPVKEKVLKKEISHILDLELSDNVKARLLDNSLSNRFQKNNKAPLRSQHAIHNYLAHKLSTV